MFWLAATVKRFCCYLCASTCCALASRDRRTLWVFWHMTKIIILNLKEKSTLIWAIIGEGLVRRLYRMNWYATRMRPLFVISLFKIVLGVSSTWHACSFYMTLSLVSFKMWLGSVLKNFWIENVSNHWLESPERYVISMCCENPTELADTLCLLWYVVHIVVT
jgi:hypothetical protein